MKRTPIPVRGRAAVRCIEQAWDLLRNEIEGLPPAVIVLLAAGARGKVLGHFAPCCWRYNTRTAAHEIAISPLLFSSPASVLLVLLHEAAHALNFSRGIQDCSGSRHYYHKISFRDTAQELGLECTFWNTRYGWTATRFSDNQVPARYEVVLKVLTARLPLGTQSQPKIEFPSGGKTPRSGHVRLRCGCQDSPNRCLYVNLSTAQQGQIYCALCQQPFGAEA